MAEAAIYETLTAIFRDAFLNDDLLLTPGLSAADVQGWDSYKQIELIIAIEEHYGIKFRTRDLDGLDNVGDLVRVIAEKTVTG
jgi:acyl carrier protein